MGPKSVGKMDGLRLDVIAHVLVGPEGRVLQNFANVRRECLRARAFRSNRPMTPALSHWPERIRNAPMRAFFDLCMNLALPPMKVSSADLAREPGRALPRIRSA